MTRQKENRKFIRRMVTFFPEDDEIVEKIKGTYGVIAHSEAVRVALAYWNRNKNRQL